MNKWIASLFAVAVASPAMADVGAPVTVKDLEKVVDNVNYVETAKTGVTLSGYVDVGYIYNFTGRDNIATRFNGAAAQDSQAEGDFNVNAVKLTLEKALPDANELAAGFRVDLMVGEDAAAFGGNAGAGALNGDSLFVEQAYVNLRLPYGNGIDLTLGKFVTWLGYEVIERPANLNITYGNLFQNMIPLYHTGIAADYAFNDIVSGGVAITNGYNNDTSVGFDNDNDGYGIMAKLDIVAPGGNANLYNAIFYSWDGSGAVLGAEDGATFIWDMWGNWSPRFADDKLLLGFNVDYGFADVATAPGTTEDWWGAALYAKYQFTDIFSLAGRADYIHSAGSTKFAGTGGGSGDIWSWTLTAGFDLLENFVFRTEYRVDIGDSITTAPGTGDAAHTFAAQAVYTF